MELVKSRLPIDAQGVIAYTARVNATRGAPNDTTVNIQVAPLSDPAVKNYSN